MRFSETITLHKRNLSHVQSTNNEAFREAMTLLNLGYRADSRVTGALAPHTSGGQLKVTSVEIWRVMMEVAENPPDSRMAPL